MTNIGAISWLKIISHELKPKCKESKQIAIDKAIKVLAEKELRKGEKKMDNKDSFDEYYREHMKQYLEDLLQLCKNLEEFWNKAPERKAEFKKMYS